MKLKLRGWQRERKKPFHSIPVKPVTKSPSGGYRAGSTDEPLKWHEEMIAFGKVDELALSGSFLVEFEFSETELRNWLRRYIQSQPIPASRLLLEMQAEALDAIAASIK